MAKLIYVANVSLDGYVEDAQGQFNWGEPSDEVFSYLTDLLRPMGTYLYGRRMYETMALWETDPSLAGQSELMADFARVWKAAHKIVYSTTLGTASTALTRVERRFDPESLRAWKATAEGDVDIGGSNLASHAFKAGLIDECELLIYPILLGGGKPAIPTEVPLHLELLDERRFDDGVVSLRYALKD